ncbi:MAG TPA: TIM barrel protein [Armatimonadota bacterium]|nr:TIM barrel protein [Armatimonadota bacterium]
MAELKLSACIEMIFGDVPEFVDRIDRVAVTGVPAVEFWGWGNKDLAAVRARTDEKGVAIAGFCVAADAALCDPEGTETWVAGAKESIAKAKEFGVPTLIVTTGNELDIPREDQHNAIVAGLKAIAPVAEAEGITLVLEPLNLLVDHAGYYLATSDEGFEILDEVNSPRVKLLYDIYHQQITEGQLIATITANIDKIGHFHVADVPGRNEPGTGEINYVNVFKAIAGTDYDGYIGLEYRPTIDAAETLRNTLSIAGL